MSHNPKRVDSGEPELRYYFVRRPVMAAVISIVVTLMGLFALQRLPVNRYPEISPPAVSVVAVYPGASAEDVALAVAAPIEQQLSGLDGLLYYQSANSSGCTWSVSTRTVPVTFTSINSWSGRCLCLVKGR